MCEFERRKIERSEETHFHFEDKSKNILYEIDLMKSRNDAMGAVTVFAVNNHIRKERFD